MTIAKIYKSLEIGMSTITKEKNLDFQEALVLHNIFITKEIST